MNNPERVNQADIIQRYFDNDAGGLFGSATRPETNARHTYTKR